MSCEYCKSNVSMIKETKIYQSHISIDKKPKICINNFHGNPFKVDFEFEINFCPICGRKL